MKAENIVLYVDSAAKCGGNGQNSTPFAKVQDAYDEAVRLLNAGAYACVKLHLRKGTHYLDRELHLDGKDILVSDYKLIISGEGEDSVVTPTVDIKGEEFTKIGENMFAYRLPESAKDAEGKFPSFRDLYIDRRHLSIARYDGEPLMQVDSAAYAEKFGLSAEDRRVFVSPVMVKDIPTDKEGYFLLTDGCGNLVKDGDGNPIRTMIEYCVKTEWQCHFLHAERVTGNSDKYTDDATGEPLLGIQIRAFDWATFVPGYKVTGDLKNCPYWCQNHPNYLKSEKEFYYNSDAGIIFLYSEKGFAGKTVSYPIADRVLHLEDIRNVTVENLTVYGTTMNYTTKYGLICGQGGSSKIVDPVTGKKPGFLPYAGIYGHNVTDIKVDKCRVSDLGNDGVFFCGAVERVSVTSCTLENVGGTAVRFGQAENTFNEKIHTKDIEIRNNYIHNTGFYNPTDPAVMVTSVLNMDLVNNTIIHCQYSAISVGYDWTTRRYFDPDKVDGDSFVNIKNANIAHNYLAEYMLGMSDGGAIYVLGGNATGNQIKYINSMNHNVAVLVHGASEHGNGYCMNYYHDGGSSHWGDYNNMLLISPEEDLPHVAYLFFQAYDPAESYHNRTQNFYIVGYPKDRTEGEKYPLDYTDETNETPVGWFTVMSYNAWEGRKASYRSIVNERTGAYTMFDLCNDKHDDIVEDVYLYRDFGDTRITPAADKAMRKIYGSVGCDFVALPPYGVLPK